MRKQSVYRVLRFVMGFYAQGGHGVWTVTTRAFYGPLLIVRNNVSDRIIIFNSRSTLVKSQYNGTIHIRAALYYVISAGISLTSTTTLLRGYLPIRTGPAFADVIAGNQIRNLCESTDHQDSITR